MLKKWLRLLRWTILLNDSFLTRTIPVSLQSKKINFDTAPKFNLKMTYVARRLNKKCISPNKTKPSKMSNKTKNKAQLKLVSIIFCFRLKDSLWD